MAKQVQTNASGNIAAETAGPVKTPAPTGRVPAPDFISQVKSPQNVGSGYGANGYAGPSSINPGQSVRSPLADNIKSSSERGGDSVLDAVISQGTAAMSIDPTGDAVRAADGVTGSQLRKIGAKNVPDSYGMASARARQPSSAITASIPAGLTDDQSDPVRQP